MLSTRVGDPSPSTFTLPLIRTIRPSRGSPGGNNNRPNLDRLISYKTILFVSIPPHLSHTCFGSPFIFLCFLQQRNEDFSHSARSFTRAILWLRGRSEGCYVFLFLLVVLCGISERHQAWIKFRNKTKKHIPGSDRVHVRTCVCVCFIRNFTSSELSCASPAKKYKSVFDTNCAKSHLPRDTPTLRFFWELNYSETLTQI